MSGERPPPGIGTLILVRHGQSTSNAEGCFTGWNDVPLTPLGERQAVTSARLLARHGLRPDRLHTSVLRRSVRSADLLLAELDRSWIPVTRSWRLNERQYGALTGRHKSAVEAEVGPRQYRTWRRSLHGTPPPMGPGPLGALRADPRYRALTGGALPATESPADIIARVTSYWVDVLAHQLRTGATVLVVAHGNSLRALTAVLDGLSAAESEERNIPTGQPLRYDFDPALRPRYRGGRYLDPDRARPAADAVAAEGTTEARTEGRTEVRTEGHPARQPARPGHSARGPAKDDA